MSKIQTFFQQMVQKRLASKMNEIRSTAGPAVENDDKQGQKLRLAKPSSACKAGGKRKNLFQNNATKAIKNEKDIFGNGAILNMDNKDIIQRNDGNK